jgi:hypothetical protein
VVVVTEVVAANICCVFVTNMNIESCTPVGVFFLYWHKWHCDLSVCCKNGT